MKHYKLTNEQLSGLKVVFASDFHVKLDGKKRLEKIVDVINKQDADIVLLGGDFVNGEAPSETLAVDEIMSVISNVHSKYGVYAVLGNHDGWYGSDIIQSGLEKIKIPVLSNESRRIFVRDKVVYIAGVEDFMTGEPDIKKALNRAKSPVILFAHNPDIFPDVPKSVAFAIAGHTHGGQIVLPVFGPPIVPSIYGQKYAYGLKKEDGKELIISRGLGTSTIYARVNCLPEIVVIDVE